MTSLPFQRLNDGALQSEGTTTMGDTRFVYLPADDDSVDASYKVIGGNGAVEIQCAPYAGGYVVNSYGYDNPSDESTLWMQDHGTFRSLDRAKRKALEVAGLKP